MLIGNLPRVRFLLTVTVVVLSILIVSINLLVWSSFDTHVNPDVVVHSLDSFSSATVDHTNHTKKRVWDLRFAFNNRISSMNETDLFLSQAKLIMHQIPDEYKPLPNWTHFPDFSIVGVMKAGTSHLYQILTHHPIVKPFNATKKENCMDTKHTLNYTSPNQELYSSLFRYHRFLNQNQTPNTTKTVNACITNIDEIIFHVLFLRTVNLNRSPKFIFVLRDPADLLFSHYNFHSFPSLDLKSSQRQWDWSHEDLDYRSPEQFHEFIVSGNRSILGKHFLDMIHAIYQDGKRMVELVGRGNVLFVKSEDMLPHKVNEPGGVLDQLSKFTQLNRNFSRQMCCIPRRIVIRVREGHPSSAMQRMKRKR